MPDQTLASTSLPAGQLAPEARAREASMLLGIGFDLCIFFPYIIVSVWGGSLTMLAETVRGGLLLALEVVVFLLLRRIQRGQMSEYEFGSGKVEQFANLLVGAAMALGAVWLASKAIGRLLAPAAEVAAHPAMGMAVSAALAAVNVVVNALAAVSLWRAGRDGTSMIMIGQIKSRFAKVFASVVVLLAIVIAAIDEGQVASVYADLGGTAFVVLVMLAVAVSLWRASLPDLLDRSLGEERQAAINRVLVQHFAEYDELLAVRSRQSGKAIHVHIELGLDPALPLARAEALSQSIAASIEAEMPGAEVVVIPRCRA